MILVGVGIKLFIDTSEMKSVQTTLTKDIVSVDQHPLTFKEMATQMNLTMIINADSNGKKFSVYPEDFLVNAAWGN